MGVKKVNSSSFRKPEIFKYSKPGKTMKIDSNGTLWREIEQVAMMGIGAGGCGGVVWSEESDQEFTNPLELLNLVRNHGKKGKQQNHHYDA